MKTVKNIIYVLLLFTHIILCADEISDSENTDDEYFDFGTAEGITIYRDSLKEFDSASMEAYILNQLNGSHSDRKEFIESEFLERAGFRRTANVRFRKTKGSEKVLSILHGIGRVVSFGLIPITMKPFFEVEYAQLPTGEYYRFENVMYASDFKNVSAEVLTVLELEYKLQIEFANGILRKDNLNYYTDENIKKFESLVLKLPDYPESIGQIKKRYLNELANIKNAFERLKNPTEDYLRALQNLNDFKEHTNTNQFQRR